MAASPDLQSPVTFVSSSPEFGGAEGLMLSIIDGLGTRDPRPSMVDLPTDELAAELRPHLTAG
jgi:hypothetical protein